MNSREKQFEYILAEALELREKGKTIPEILDLFPEHKRELQKMLTLVGMLEKQKKSTVKAREELAAKIVKQLSIPGPTRKQEKRQDTISHDLLTIRWKFVLPTIGIALLLLVTLATFQFPGTPRIVSRPVINHEQVSPQPEVIPDAVVTPAPEAIDVATILTEERSLDVDVQLDEYFADERTIEEFNDLLNQL